MPPRTLNNDILNAALIGLEAKKQQIDSQIAELRQMLSGDGAGRNVTGTLGRGGRGRRRMSAEGRARIAEAQRQRWATKRGESQESAVRTTKPKAKRKLSP